MSSSRSFFTISPSPEELFVFLLRKVQPPFIMDIGSRDATEAKRFKPISPASIVYAVEPHPVLFSKMCQDQDVSTLGIRPVNCALADKQGELTFYINDAQALNGSLRKSEGAVRELSVKVDRLDNVVGSEIVAPAFLWVDVEGLAWEVIQGGARSLDRVACIHIEYETEPLFEDQKTFSEVKALLAEKGFSQWADTYCEEVSQGNALFIRRGKGGLSFASSLLLLAVYPWFTAKVIYRNYKNARRAAS